MVKNSVTVTLYVPFYIYEAFKEQEGGGRGGFTTTTNTSHFVQQNNIGILLIFHTLHTTPPPKTELVFFSYPRETEKNKEKKGEGVRPPVSA